MKNIQVAFEDTAKIRFQGVCIATVFLNDIQVRESSAWLRGRIEQAVEYVQREYAGMQSLSMNPTIAAYRNFFKKIRIDPTKVRPSGEALIRMILKQGRIPVINHVVDSMNIVSSMTGLSLSVFDTDKIIDNIIVRIALPGEHYVPHGNTAYATKGGELIVADSEKILCLYPYRDTIATRVTEETKNIVLQVHGVPGINKESIHKAADDTLMLMISPSQREMPTIQVISS